MAPKNKSATTANAATSKNPETAFTPSENDISLMREIDKAAASGTFRFVSQAEAGHLANAGLVVVNTTMLDQNGNAAAQLTETGKAMTPTETPVVNNTAPASGTSTAAVSAAAPSVSAPVSFAIANVAPPAIKRTPPTGGGQKPKYPQLDSLEEGQALFIPAAPGQDTKKLSKTFGSMMADRNSKNKDKYFTSRGIPDGKEAGFVGVFPEGSVDATGAPNAGQPNPDAFAGVAGTGLYRRPLSERKVRAPRKAKDGATTTTQTPEELAAAAALAQNGGVSGIPGAPGTDAAGETPAVV